MSPSASTSTSSMSSSLPPQLRGHDQLKKAKSARVILVCGDEGVRGSGEGERRGPQVRCRLVGALVYEMAYGRTPGTEPAGRGCYGYSGSWSSPPTHDGAGKSSPTS